MSYDTKPSCSKKRYLSPSTQLSTILPSSNRSISTPLQVAFFSVAAIPRKSPVWVAVSVQWVATRSPSAICVNTRNFEAEKALVIVADQLFSGL